MADDGKGGGGGVAIIVALIGTCGVLGAAYIANSSHFNPGGQSNSTGPVNAIGQSNSIGPANSTDSDDTSGKQPPAVHMSLLVPNTSYSGSDYTQISAASATDCSDDCLAQSQCRSMTYAISTHLCWLKTSVPPAQHGSDFVAAAKIGG